MARRKKTQVVCVIKSHFIEGVVLSAAFGFLEERASDVPV